MKELGFAIRFDVLCEEITVSASHYRHIPTQPWYFILQKIKILDFQATYNQSSFDLRRQMRSTNMP